jgi:hypothetical protein
MPFKENGMGASCKMGANICKTHVQQLSSVHNILQILKHKRRNKLIGK